jgi:hypothetical protein
MVFLRRLPIDALALRDRQITFEPVNYLDPDAAENQPALDEVCRKLGIAPERLRTQPIDGGVPHVIPASVREPLADAWLECIELFPVIVPWSREQVPIPASEMHLGPQRPWLTAMWSLVLAVHRLGLEPVMTEWCISNYSGSQPLPTRARLIHYCYSDGGFDKRRFDGMESAEERVWQAALGDDTISGTVRRQLLEAARFYGLSVSGEW